MASVWLVAYGLFQVPGGLLGDWLGGRYILTALVLAWSLILAAVVLIVWLPPATALPFAALLLLRFLFGMFQAGGFPVLARVVGDWVPRRERGSAQGMVWTFSRLGGALAPLFYLWLFAAFDDWAMPMWLLGSVGALWCAGFWPWFRNRPEEMKGVNAAERDLIESGRGPAPARPEPLPLSRFLGSRNVWALCMLYGFTGFAGNFFTSLSPVYLRDHRHLNKQEAAWLFALPLAAGTVSCVLGGVLSDWLIRRTGSRKWGRRLTGFVGLALAGLVFVSTIWVEEVWLLGLLFSLTFFFNDSNMGPAWASCADVGERYAGTLSGAMNMVGAFLGAAGMAFAGACFKRQWDEPVFVVFACSYGLGSLCWLMVDVTKPLAPKGQV
jgi:sugar phosphate permease